MILDLAVLDRDPTEGVVELDRLDGGGAGLVLGGLSPQPEVEVIPSLRGLNELNSISFMQSHLTFQ